MAVLDRFYCIRVILLHVITDLTVMTEKLSKARFHQIKQLQSKLFITSLVITEYSISDINLLGTDLFPLKFPLYNRIFT